MKRIFTGFLFIVISQVVCAQDYQLHLNGDNFLPEETKNFKDSNIGFNTFLQRSYPIIQFYQIPTSAKIKTMEAAGIKFLQYIPNNAYFVSVKNNSVLELFSNDIRSVFTLPLKNKMDKYCYELNFPDWAIQRDGKIDVMVSYAADITETEIMYLLKNYISGSPIIQHEVHAVRLAIKPEQVHEIAGMSFVYFIEANNDKPIKEETRTRSNHRSNFIDRRGTGEIELRGNGISVGLNDDGIVGPHIDFQGRIKGMYATNPNENDDHGDHCAGIITGAGNRDPKAEGMASGADLYVYEVGLGGSATGYQGIDSLSIHYNTKNIRILSTSYSDVVIGVYNSRSQLLDIQERTMPLMMHVFSAGNSGTSDFGYGAGAGWANITGGHKQAKNIISVGNLSYNDVLASGSSRGPAYDGRIKPDICAVGTSVYSTKDNNTYVLKSGTSMACPGISGVLAQLMEGYKLTHGGNEAPSNLLKCIIQNTADDLGNPGPDFKFGYGRVNARRAYDVISRNQFITGSAGQGDSTTFNITVPPGTKQLRVMVSWPDKESVPNAARALVNNLDMGVINPASQITFPYILDPTPNPVNLNLPATRGIDTLNNMEQVVIDNPTSGTYTIYVKGTAVPFGPQTFYISYEFVSPDLILTYPIGKESFAPGTIETIRWDDYGNASSNYTLEYSTNNGSNWTTLSSGISAASRYYDWNIPNTSGIVTGKALMRITRNGGSSATSLQPFSIIGVPSGLTVNWVCGDSMEVSYNAVTGAVGYKLSVLGEKYMDSIGVSTTTQIISRSSTLIPPGGWFTVQALGPDGAVGPRAMALPYSYAPFNCPCSGQPSTGPMSGPTSICVNDFNTFSILNQQTSSITYQWQTSASGQPGSWVNQPGANTPSISIQRSEAFYIRVYITCSESGLSDTSQVQYVTIKPLTACYCTPTVNTIDELITNITVGALNNSSTGSGINGYEDFTSLPATELMKDSNHQFSASVSPYYSGDTLAVWIDFNQDGIFQHPAERVLNKAVLSAITTDNINIPQTALDGITRMRVRVAYLAENLTPCSNETWGNTEDYLVEILSACGVESVPYVAPIDVPTVNPLPNCMTGDNFNPTAPGWKIVSTPDLGFANNYLMCKLSAGGNSDMDAWVYTNAIQLNTGEDYLLTFKYGNVNAAYPDKLAIYIGTENNVGAMNNQLFINDDIRMGGSTHAGVAFTVPVSGIYYIGFHGYSPAQSSGLALGDIVVDLGRPVLVKMSELRGRLINNNIARLSWETNIEVDNAGFEIERSEDGIHFRKIGFMPSLGLNGSSNTLLEYRFNDTQPVDAISFYRIIQKDFDGTGYISNIVRLGINEGGPQKIKLLAVPNPVTSGMVTIQIEGSQYLPAKIRLINVLGSVVGIFEANDDKLRINMSRFAAGVYLLQYEDKNQKATIKIIKK